MGSKTMDLASAVLHKTIATPQQHFQAEASRLRAAMVAAAAATSPSRSLANSAAPERQQRGGHTPVSQRPGRWRAKKYYYW